jgi:hypothetical protein
MSGSDIHSNQANIIADQKYVPDKFKGIQVSLDPNDLAWLSKITGKVNLKPSDLLDGFSFLQVPTSFINFRYYT